MFCFVVWFLVCCLFGFFSRNPVSSVSKLFLKKKLNECKYIYTVNECNGIIKKYADPNE